MTGFINFLGLIFFVASVIFILLHIIDVIQTKINEQATLRYFILTIIRFIIAIIVLLGSIRLLEM